MSNRITVYEHQSIRLGQQFGNLIFDAKVLESLQQYSGTEGVPYYSLIHNGIRFNEHVGVIQVGRTTIEVLPKADFVSSEESNPANWRKLLIGMLRATGEIEVKSSSNSDLKLQENAILDLYFELFIKEVEWLLHNGLIKQYRKKNSNLTTLKGNLLFSKNIQINHAHAERFFVRHTTYDKEHLIHFLIYKAIKLLNRINTNNLLQNRISVLLLHFPEMPEIKISEQLFEKVVFTRKNQSYKTAINIAKLLLLKLHPDIIHGRNDVLALMFDMNLLWEKFVYKSLRKYKYPGFNIKDQVSKPFWKSEDGSKTKIIPDIVIKDESNNKNYVLDTKWKNLNGNNPSPEDLRQLYVYHKYYEADQVALIYPGEESYKSGIYLDQKVESDQLYRCGVICLEFRAGMSIDSIQKKISAYILSKITPDIAY